MIYSNVSFELFIFKIVICCGCRPRTVRPPNGVLPGQPTTPSFSVNADRVYGSRVDNYNKRNATQWDQSWK